MAIIWKEIVDTTDATATSKDILEGTSAYINNKKVEGSMIDYSAENDEIIFNSDEKVHSSNAELFKFFSNTNERIYTFFADKDKIYKIYGGNSITTNSINHVVIIVEYNFITGLLKSYNFTIANFALTSHSDLFNYVFYNKKNKNVIIYNNKVHIFGNATNSSIYNIPTTLSIREYYSKMHYILDLETGQVEKKNNCFFMTEEDGYIVFNNKINFISGSGIRYIYDEVNDSWDEGTVFTSNSFTQSSMAVTDSKIHIFPIRPYSMKKYSQCIYNKTVNEWYENDISYHIVNAATSNNKVYCFTDSETNYYTYDYNTAEFITYVFPNSLYIPSSLSLDICSDGEYIYIISYDGQFFYKFNPDEVNNGNLNNVKYYNNIDSVFYNFDQTYTNYVTIPEGYYNGTYKTNDIVLNSKVYTPSNEEQTILLNGNKYKTIGNITIDTANSPERTTKIYVSKDFLNDTINCSDLEPLYNIVPNTSVIYGNLIFKSSTTSTGTETFTVSDNVTTLDIKTGIPSGQSIFIRSIKVLENNIYLLIYNYFTTATTADTQKLSATFVRLIYKTANVLTLSKETNLHSAHTPATASVSGNIVKIKIIPSNLEPSYYCITKETITQTSGTIASGKLDWNMATAKTSSAGFALASDTWTSICNIETSTGGYYSYTPSRYGGFEYYWKTDSTATDKKLVKHLLRPWATSALSTSWGDILSADGMLILGKLKDGNLLLVGPYKNLTTIGYNPITNEFFQSGGDVWTGTYLDDFCYDSLLLEGNILIKVNKNEENVKAYQILETAEDEYPYKLFYIGTFDMIEEKDTTKIVKNGIFSNSFYGIGEKHIDELELIYM